MSNMKRARWYRAQSVLIRARLAWLDSEIARGRAAAAPVNPLSQGHVYGGGTPEHGSPEDIARSHGPGGLPKGWRRRS